MFHILKHTDCEPSCPGCVALRAKKAALEQEMEMLKIKKYALLSMCKELSAELLKETAADMPTNAGFFAEPST